LKRKENISRNSPQIVLHLPADNNSVFKHKTSLNSGLNSGVGIIIASWAKIADFKKKGKLV
jgi:hypothetical protein